MTYLTILIATLLFIIIPIASSTLARLIHFTLGLQGDTFNMNSIFGKVGLWLLMDSDSKLVNLFKDAVTCIFCLTHHIALLETIVAYTWLFGPWGLLSLLIVPAVALMVQNLLQIKIYSHFYLEEDTNQETNDGSN